MRLIMTHQKINILFLIDSLTSVDGLVGGTERQLIQIINRLDRKYFNPFLVCLRGDIKNSFWESVDCKKYIFDVFSLVSVNGAIKFVSFVKFLKMNNINMVQTYFFDSTLFGILSAKIARIDITISCRRDMGFWYNKNLLRNLKFVNKLTKRILVNSHAIKKIVSQKEKVPIEKIDIIHNAIDIHSIKKQAPIPLDFISNYRKNTDKIIGIVGNYNRRIKRHDIFIKAAVEVLKKFDNIKFLIVGGGILENDLKSLANELNVSQNIIFIGKKDNPISYIKTFDVGVLSSDSEGFPNVILEYMACGIPVVATNVGGTQELIQNGVSGILVEKGDYISLADSICKLIVDQKFSKHLGQNGRDFVFNKFSWENIISDIQLYYENLIQARHAQMRMT